MSQGKSKKVIAAGLLIMSLTMSCNSSLSPILAEVGKSFPEASDSAIHTDRTDTYQSYNTADDVHRAAA